MPSLAPPDPAGSNVAKIVAQLEAEIGASGDDVRRKAILRWEIARVHESRGKLGNAVRAHLDAFNQDPTFLAPLHALVRIMERIRSSKNLERLYREQARRMPDAPGRAAAMLDLAAYREDREKDAEKARERLADAFETDARVSALAVERVARRDGDDVRAMETLAIRADAVAHPVLRALLMAELAEARAGSGALDAAFLDLDRALTMAAARHRVLETMEKLARAHGRDGALARALEGQGELAAEAA
ncbi:MAG: hypothetical protein AAGH15_21325, partial [Myxococcota bacterium]